MNDICMYCKRKWDEHNDKEYITCVNKLTKWLDK